MTTATTTTSTTTTASARRVLLAGVVAAVLAAAVDAGIALVVVAAGVPQVPALTPRAGAVVAAVAAVLGAVGWQVVRRRAADPRRVLVRLVPAVLLLSFVPDVLLAVVTVADTGIAPILALALLHVVTIAIAVAVYARLLPVPAAGSAA